MTLVVLALYAKLQFFLLCRIVLRLRVVFLKQCFAWMVHGELDDPGFEFFVTGRETHSVIGQPSQPRQYQDSHGEVLLDQVMRKLYQAKMTTDDMFSGTLNGSNGNGNGNGASSTKNFDWTSSYTLSLENIPCSHVSPRIAGKILFAGKAVKLLQSSGLLSRQTSRTNHKKDAGLPVIVESLGYASSDAYKYLSSGCAFDVSPFVAEEKTMDPAALSSGASHAFSVSESDAAVGSDPQVRQAYQQYVESGGYTVEDTVQFTEQFSHILRHPDQAVELLEAAVERINDTISNRLWALLRDSYGFLPFLQVIRSTYLLGRGELFQSLLDGVLALTYAPTPAGLEMDNILNWKVLRSSAKLVGLENDDSLNELIKLRVNNADMVVRNFAQHKPDLQLLGAAVELPVLGFDGPSPHATPVSGSSVAQGLRVGQRTLVELCRPAAATSYEQFQRTWTHFLRKKAVSGDQIRNISSSHKRGASYTSRSVNGLTGEEDGDDDDTQDISDLDDDSLDGDEHTQKTSSSPRPTPYDLRRSNGAEDDSYRVPPNNKRGASLKYCRGAIRIIDQKFVSRGFVQSSTFMCSWNDLRVQLTSAHPFFKAADNDASSEMQPPHAQHGLFPPVGRGIRAVTLGSVACALYGDRKSDAQSQGGTRVGSLAVGVKFYGTKSRFLQCYVTFTNPFLFFYLLFSSAMTMSGVSGVRYYARLFMRTGNAPNSSGFSAYSHRHSVEPALRKHSFLRTLATSFVVFNEPCVEFFIDEELFGDGVIDIDDNLQGLGLDQFIQRYNSPSLLCSSTFYFLYKNLFICKNVQID